MRGWHICKLETMCKLQGLFQFGLFINYYCSFQAATSCWGLLSFQTPPRHNFCITTNSPTSQARVLSFGHSYVAGAKTLVAAGHMSSGFCVQNFHLFIAIGYRADICRHIPLIASKFKDKYFPWYTSNKEIEVYHAKSGWHVTSRNQGFRSINVEAAGA